ncbi:MAG: hypothetical protein ACYTG1_11715 [Planctomycetota bacterium]|jgi:hypothetical protein
MADSARVSSFEALGRFRAAFADFGDAGRSALGNAEADVRRTIWWLQHEQVNHWKRQVRRREQLLAQAKSELFRAELAPPGERRSASVERKAVQKAEHRVAEAHEKIRRCEHWGRVLDREFLLYRGQTQPLATLIDREGPKGVARIGKMMDHLERYVRVAPPRTDASRPAPAAAPPPDDDADEPAEPAP